MTVSSFNAATSSLWRCYSFLITSSLYSHRVLTLLPLKITYRCDASIFPKLNISKKITISSEQKLLISKIFTRIMIIFLDPSQWFIRLSPENKSKACFWIDDTFIKRLNQRNSYIIIKTVVKCRLVLKIPYFS